jgi:hypothetical protein
MRVEQNVFKICAGRKEGTNTRKVLQNTANDIEQQISRFRRDPAQINIFSQQNQLIAR